ncbi:MAG: hypothetical protein WAT71_10600 [Ignavibacteria bacterium]
MKNQEFLNFAEISKVIQFSELLDWLNIPYQKKNNELRGEGFIVSIEKNLFFTPNDNNLKGSVINFLAHQKQISLREAALLLKQQFISQKIDNKPKRDIPELILLLDDYFSERNINPEIVVEYEAGYVKQRSIVAGRIAFKIYDSQSNHIGYIGYKKEDNSWFFPKGFVRPLYNIHRINEFKAVVVTTDVFDALRIISLGIKQVVSLLAKSMTAAQEEELKKFKYIFLFHPEPENIVNRLFKTSFIKSPTLIKPLADMSNNELLKLIKPSS